MTEKNKNQCQIWKILCDLDSATKTQIKDVHLSTVPNSSRGNAVNSVLFSTNNDDVFAIGCNKEGRLGVGDKKDRNTPTRVPELSGKHLVAIYSDIEHHMLALTNDGAFYRWGNRQHYQAGSNGSVLRPCLVPAPGGSQVRQVACGYLSSVILTADGRVWSWGSNAVGQLGHSADKPEEPQQVECLPPVAHIGCCALSSFALTVDGELFAWGSNTAGELGRGTKDGNDHEGHRAPGRVAAPSLAASASHPLACGQFHAIGLTESGQIVAWGLNRHGQVGAGDDDFVLYPRKVTSIDVRYKAVAVSPFSNFSVAQAEEGEIYAWGRLGDETVRHPTATEYSTLQEALSFIDAAPLSLYLSAQTIRH